MVLTERRGDVRNIVGVHQTRLDHDQKKGMPEISSMSLSRIETEFIHYEIHRL